MLAWTTASNSDLSAGGSPPGPVDSEGEVLRKLRESPLHTLEALRREFGSIVRFPVGGVPGYLVSDPRLIKQVLETDAAHYRKGRAQRTGTALLGQGLLASEGELHRIRRAQLMPAFGRRHFPGYAPAIARLATEMTDRWSDGDEVRIYPEMRNLSLRIISLIAFDFDPSVGVTSLGNAVADVVGPGNPATALFSDGPASLAGEDRSRVLRARAVIDDFANGIVARWKRNEGRSTPLRDALVGPDPSHPALDDSSIEEEVRTVLIAGHQTLTAALVWSLSLLSRNPPVADQVEREVDEALRTLPIGQFDARRFGYSIAFVHEVLRLYPPVWMLSRKPIDLRPLGGYIIPPEAEIMISPWLVHRDPRNFTHPLDCIPARWESGTEEATFIPFGLGPRGCIAASHSISEVTLVLAIVCHRWSVHLAPGSSPEPIAATTLLARNDGAVTISLRG